MGFPDGHTDMLSRRARYQCLWKHIPGYHLSALKRLFPEGIEVLSLFSGIVELKLLYMSSKLP
ncbi:hypothetical protein ACET3Z_013979 [Daucus carota]